MEYSLPKCSELEEFFFPLPDFGMSQAYIKNLGYEIQI